MSLDEFLVPKFEGKRFEGHALPLEFLRDLSSLSEMVTEVAKARYRGANPNRKRVSPGFSDDISLVLTGIREGSAVPVIAILAGLSGILPHSSLDYYKEAREDIIGAMNAANEGRSPGHFLNDKGLAYFEKLGRSLRDGESIEFSAPDLATTARLTKETRRALLLSSAKVEEVDEEVEIRGRLDTLRQGTSSFIVKLANGNEVACKLTDEDYENIIAATRGYREGAKILLRGVGIVNRQGKILRIDAIEHSAVLDPLDIPARFEELKLLKDGWLDGVGVAPSHSGLDRLAAAFHDHYRKDLPLPYAYPLPEGGVQFEWSLKPDEISLEIDLESDSAYWHVLDAKSGEGEARDLNLRDPADWRWLTFRIDEMKKGVLNE